MGPLCPDGCDSAAGGDGSAKSRRCATIATHLGVCDTEDWVVVGPLALNGWWTCTRGEAGVSGVGGPTDDVGCYGSVAADGGGEERRGGEEAVSQMHVADRKESKRVVSGNEGRDLSGWFETKEGRYRARASTAKESLLYTYLPTVIHFHLQED